MSYNTYTTDDLFSDVEVLGHLPTSGNATFDESKVLQIANWELQTPLMKQIIATRGGYYLTYVDNPIVSTGLYLIPYDCVAGGLANVELVQDPTIVPVNLLEESEQFSTISPTSTSYGFFMKGNYVQILPIPNVGVARLWYFKRTSKMVATSSCSQITAVDSTFTIFTVSSVPTTIVSGDFVDVVGDQPPFNILGENIQISSIVGTTITLASPVLTAGVNNWIALNGQTCIPQIPVEFRLILAQRIVCKIYELQGYLDKLKAAKEILREYEQASTTLITPRVKSATKIVNPVNGGFLAGRNRYSNFPAGRSG